MPPQKHKRGKAAKQKKKLLDVKKLSNATAIHTLLNKKDKLLLTLRKMEEMEQQGTFALIAVWLVVG